MRSFYFGIPLRAKSTTDNWDLVCDNLKRTLDCLLSQEDAAPGVFIAGHDRPEFLQDSDQVRFIDVSQAAPPPVDVEGFNLDKKLKKTWIGYELRQAISKPVYYMHMDADDLLQKRFVRRILKDDNESGYLIKRGFMVDVANRTIARLDEKTAPFYKHCGSCAVIYFSPDELPKSPQSGSSNYSQYRHHAEYGDVAAAQGKTLHPMSAYAGAYLVNHGENNRRYRGMDHKKVNFVERNRISDAEKLSAVCADFKGLDQIMAQADA